MEEFEKGELVVVVNVDGFGATVLQRIFEVSSCDGNITRVRSLTAPFIRYFYHWRIKRLSEMVGT